MNKNDNAASKGSTSFSSSCGFTSLRSSSLRILISIYLPYCEKAYLALIFLEVLGVVVTVGASDAHRPLLIPLRIFSLLSFLWTMLTLHCLKTLASAKGLILPLHRPLRWGLHRLICCQCWWCWNPSTAATNATATTMKVSAKQVADSRSRHVKVEATVSKLEQWMTLSLLTVLCLYLYGISTVLATTRMGDPWAFFEVFSLAVQGFVLTVLFTIRERLRDGDMVDAENKRKPRMLYSTMVRERRNSIANRVIRAISLPKAVTGLIVDDVSGIGEDDGEDEEHGRKASVIRPEGSYRYAFDEVPNPLHINFEDRE